MPTSIKSFARSASVLALLAIAVRADDPPVAACGFAEESLADLTTFDPMILGDDTWDGLYFDPFVHGFGGACDDCGTKAIADDWRGFLGAEVDPSQWDRVLRKASAPDLAVLRAFAAGKAKAPPKGYERIPPGPRVVAALDYVALMNDVAPYAAADRPTDALPADRAKRAQAGMTAAKDPFLVQRYGFLALRALFYERAWRRAVAFFDEHAAALAGPSVDLRWRARYYAAGALAHDGKRARANLELARITSGYQPLAGAAAGDFQPVEEADWKATLALARDVREKTELWQLVGIKADGIVAMEKILELDPKSNLVALLLVRELTRAESSLENGEGKPDPEKKKALERIEKIATRITATPGADRPWLAELVAGHIAAKRGDLVAARLHLQRAVTLAPKRPAVATQAKASLALALVLDWRIDAAHEEELAHLMLEVDPKFSRLATVRTNVRGKLAKAYALAGKIVDSELLASGAGNWNDVEFIKQVIARTGQTASAFDRFVVSGITKEQLQAELYGRYLLLGDFVDAQKVVPAKPEPLGTDPFVAHIVDCHDCDHEKYATAPWTDASFTARLVELQRTAAGKSEAAAQAALELGNALYNLTWFGNARVVLESTRQATRDTRPAERWYKRAFDTSKNRELKARAAYLAAKAELARLVDAEDAAQQSDVLPVPTTWFPVLRGMSETQYYKEVLKECGNFRRWVAKKP